MIRKAIIPAAGYGTRSLPITKVIPKEMFPIGAKPAIQFVVEEAIASGIEQILMVVSRTKSIIIDYFDHSLELEAFLEKKNKSHLIHDSMIPDIRIHYVRQPFANGLGDAIRLGEEFIGNEPFAVLLPDDILIGENEPGLLQLVNEYHTFNNSVIGLKSVAKEQLQNYGVINGNKTNEHVYELNDIVEKPKINPPSNLAVIGRYVFTPTIFKYLNVLKPGVGGELQLTDAIKQLLQHEKCYGKVVTGERYDIGSVKDYLKLINKITNI